MFIVLEGVEGSGKSTQVRLLDEWLTERGIDHIVTREPGGTATGEEIRRILLESEHIPPRAELLLMLAARAVFVDERVRPVLERGGVVVADRYELSTLAYQAYGRGLPVEDVRRMNAFATRGLVPDLTIVLDVPPEVGEARRVREGRGADRIEQAGATFHRKVAEAYRLLAETEPRVERIDGTGAPEVVRAEVLRVLRSYFPETFAPGEG